MKRLFVLSAGGLLLITAAAKVISSFGSAGILQLKDPIVQISFKNLLLVVGLVELVVACFCFFGKPIKWQIGSIAWLSTGFALYRLGLAWIGFHGPCPCLGTLSDSLHIPPETVNTAMKAILSYLLFGSYYALAHLSFRQWKKSNPKGFSWHSDSLNNATKCKKES